ncbi:MAG: hypothetical protein PHT41_05885 [Candidatus Omnitrophica bacterium]|nr:hypothetical protein [Candidatus Omnitrophota bacterium]
MNKITFLIPAILLLLLTLVMFGNVIFSSQNIILSSAGTDIFLHFFHWREFGFSQLRSANLALWNPYIFSGAPFLGAFQSALLYPLNTIYMFLPVQKTINIDIALHIFLSGLFMYLWAFQRKLHPLSCFLSAVLFMFCGAHFLHIYAGHLAPLCTMAWVPLLFLAIDGLFEYRSFNWCLLGIFAITMQILAGYPQYLFYTTIAAVLYYGFCIIKARERFKITLGILTMYAGALALGAVQVLTGIQAASESVRAGGVPFKFASMFSFPPENFITFFVPNFFGDNVYFPYWGRCYLWEMSTFAGITGLFLALYASFYAEKNLRRFSVTTALLLLLLALGAHTPLFGFLYKWIPGFDLFRGSSKFVLPASLFIALLAGIGLDRIIRFQLIPKSIIICVLSVAVFFIAVAFYLQYALVAEPVNKLWHSIFQSIQATGESYLLREYKINSAFISQAGIFTAKNMLIAARICLLVALLFILRRFSRRISYIIALVAIAEVFLFAKHSLAHFDFSLIQPPTLKKLSVEHPGDYRILYLDNPNNTMLFRTRNIWGYDQCVLKRYAEFMAFTQGRNIKEATLTPELVYFHPLYKMLRCRYIFPKNNTGINIIDSQATMPRLLLIHDWLLISKRDDIFAKLQNPSFNPYKTVILEKEPDPLPVESSQQETVRIINSSTDHLTIEALLSSPAILVITDNYSKGWRVRPLRQSIQKKYEVMPANYILCSIPLSSGYHYFRLEYVPGGFEAGKWITLISLIIYIFLVGRTLRNKFKTPPNAKAGF